MTCARCMLQASASVIMKYFPVDLRLFCKYNIGACIQQATYLLLMHVLYPQGNVLSDSQARWLMCLPNDQNVISSSPALNLNSVA